MKAGVSKPRSAGRLVAPLMSLITDTLTSRALLLLHYIVVINSAGN